MIALGIPGAHGMSCALQGESDEPINASVDDNDNPRYQTDDFRMLYMKVLWAGPSYALIVARGSSLPLTADSQAQACAGQG